MSEQVLFLILDLFGTFVFAVSGAIAAKQNELDVFGVLVIAFVTSCGGGIIRDICLGATPPAGLINWHYLVTALFASVISVFMYEKMSSLKNPVLFFDAIGLGFFSVAGAQKVLILDSSAQAAILLGTISACGGGVIRDVLLSRVPIILRREIYASAALIASSLVVLGHVLGWPDFIKVWMPIGVCIGLRMLSVRLGIHLPSFGGKKSF